jgi:1,4-alpha-glucan branching enzyme
MWQGDGSPAPVGRAYPLRLMITKKAVDRGTRVKVTFTLPNSGPQRVVVVGDFNHWDISATPMRKRGDVRSASVTLDTGRRYAAFRSLDESGHWFNDDHADELESNAFGGTNCIIDLPGPRSS